MYKKRAFTLIELLVVIAIIALLMAILMPALSAAKKQAQGSACLNNQRGLMTAYVAYATDEDDKLACGNTFGPTAWNPPPAGEWQWCRGPLDSSGNDAGGNVTMEQRFDGIRAGALWSYTKDVKVYHCPADTRARRGTVRGTSLHYHMYRTYEIQAGLNGEEDLQSGFSLKLYSQIKKPAYTYVFIEGYYDGWGGNYNAGSWMLDQDNNGQSWWNAPALWHVNAYTLGYADGHAAMWKIKDNRTIEYAKDRFNTDRNQPDNPDLQHLIDNYAVPLPRN